MEVGVSDSEFEKMEKIVNYHCKNVIHIYSVGWLLGSNERWRLQRHKKSTTVIIFYLDLEKSMKIICTIISEDFWKDKMKN